MFHTTKQTTMKKFIYTFGILSISCLLTTACSVDVNEDAAKKNEEKESAALMNAPSEETSLMASNEFAFERKGCKYRW